MIVYDIGKIVCGKAVGLYQDHILKLGIINAYLAVDLINKLSLSFILSILSYDIRAPFG